MDKYYKVVMVYPDGHIEEIEEAFKSGEDALEYGNRLLAEIPNMERYRSAFDEEKRDPYFMIVEVNNKKTKLVYESRR